MTDLIGTLEVPGEFDAMSKLRPGEPYFLLLGRDRLAPDLVRKWAHENRLRALKEFDDDVIDLERRTRELRKSTDAEMIAETMREFKRGDLERREAGQPTVKTYSGHELPEETRLRDAVQSARIRAAAGLRSAVSEIAGLSLAIDNIPTAVDASLRYELDAAVKAMNELADKITPKRPVP